jgi:hypothetical protein
MDLFPLYHPLTPLGPSALSTTHYPSTALYTPLSSPLSPLRAFITSICSPLSPLLPSVSYAALSPFYKKCFFSLFLEMMMCFALS